MKFQRFILIAAMSILAVSCRQTPEVPSSEGSTSLPQESTSQPIDSSSSDPIEKYTVTFYCNGKKAKEEEIEKGGHVDMPSDIDYSRYFALKDKGYYVHWYKVVGLDKFTFDFNSEIVDSDLNIYAEYIAKSMTMTLDIGRGVDNPTMDVTFDSHYLIPDSSDYICGYKAEFKGQEIPFEGIWTFDDMNGVIRFDVLDNYGFSFRETEDGTGYILTRIDLECLEINLPMYYRGKPVKSIAEGCFAGSKVRKLSVPNSYVSNISEINACDYLEELTIPFKSVPLDFSQNVWAVSSKTLLKLTLTGEGKLQWVDFSNGYTSWTIYDWDEARQKCNKAFPKLTSVVLSDGITSIDQYAFYGCSFLASIDIPDSVTSIGGSAFRGCASLASVSIPDSVASIGDRAFSSCFSLSSIDIPASVASIGKRAFEDCASLASVSIPDSVTSIGPCVFAGCTSLASIVIPDSVTSIGGSAFSGCVSLASVSIPDSVTSIGGSAFQGCTSLSSIDIPASVATIDVRAFSGCSSLASIDIPDSVTSIGYCAFDDCASLASVSIPDSVTSIDVGAFSGCVSLASIVIPDSVTSIGGSAFSDCTSLPSIVIPDSVTSIGPYVFLDCTSLASIVIPDSVTSIDESAFCGCTSLSSIVIPDSVTSIDESAFCGCSFLASIDIPDSVTSIGPCVFAGCTSLASIVIPDSVTSIGESAFYGCTSLTDIYCEALSQPAEWDSSWNNECKATIHWGVTAPSQN